MSDPKAIRSAMMIANRLTDAQKEAGNYKKHHERFQGLPLTIENEKGSERSGIDKNGKKWSTHMPAHYGYIKGTEGADGDHVDAYVGPNKNSNKVFVVNQKDANSSRFDEHKVLLGFNSIHEALKTYTKGFSDGRGDQRVMSFVPMSLEEFKGWLKNHDTTRPIDRSKFAFGGRTKLADGGGGNTDDNGDAGFSTQYQDDSGGNNGGQDNGNNGDSGNSIQYQDNGGNNNDSGNSTQDETFGTSGFGTGNAGDTSIDSGNSTQDETFGTSGFGTGNAGDTAAGSGINFNSTDTSDSSTPPTSVPNEDSGISIQYKGTDTNQDSGFSKQYQTDNANNNDSGFSTQYKQDDANNNDSGFSTQYQDAANNDVTSPPDSGANASEISSIMANASDSGDIGGGNGIQAFNSSPPDQSYFAPHTEPRSQFDSSATAYTPATYSGPHSRSFDAGSDQTQYESFPTADQTQYKSADAPDQVQYKSASIPDQTQYESFTPSFKATQDAPLPPVNVPSSYQSFGTNNTIITPPSNQTASDSTAGLNPLYGNSNPIYGDGTAPPDSKPITGGFNSIYGDKTSNSSDMHRDRDFSGNPATQTAAATSTPNSTQGDFYSKPYSWYNPLTKKWRTYSSTTGLPTDGPPDQYSPTTGYPLARGGKANQKVIEQALKKSNVQPLSVQDIIKRLHGRMQ